jgi:hypothetical protein
VINPRIDQGEKNMVRLGMAVVTAGLVLAGCGRADDAAANNSAASAESSANAGAPPANVTAETRTDLPPPPLILLAGNGIPPLLHFDMPQAEAVRLATQVYGAPTGREHNDECGEGPMDFVSFHGLQLGFLDRKLAGWSLSDREPALRTTRGLAIGAPRSALGNTEIDEESSLGPEFLVDEVGGILDQSGARIEALWAGDTCQFR